MTDTPPTNTTPRDGERLAQYDSEQCQFGNKLAQGYELTEVRTHEASAADLRADARALSPSTTDDQK